jgi:hypothetical protein
VWWDAKTGFCDELAGNGHTNEVTDMVVDGDRLVSIGVDDAARFSSVSGKTFMCVEFL